MKEKVYLFGAYMGLHTNGNKGWGNFLLEFPSMPSIDEMKNTIRKGNEELSSAIVLNMHSLPKSNTMLSKARKSKKLKVTYSTRRLTNATYPSE